MNREEEVTIVDQKTGLVYFKGLNGVRALACMIVVVFHIDQFFPLFGVESGGYSKSGMAGYGVTLFFVLSGYLISYLLLVEKERFRKVDIPKFYIRRILRIWPVYYLVILFTILLLVAGIIPNNDNSMPTILIYSLLLSNFGYAFGLGLITIAPLWSVGVEEQFYLFWPVLLNKCKNVLKMLLGVIIIYLLIKVTARFIGNNTLYGLVSLTAFDSMAIGGVASFLFFSKSKLLEILYNPLLQIVAWFILLISIFYRPIHIASLFDNEIHSVVYAILILNVSTNPNTIVKLENRLFNFIGKISYGIYVYHMLVIVLLSYFLKNTLLHIQDIYWLYGIIYFLVISITIAIAHLSFVYFESYFLRRKNNFMKVKSTNVKLTSGI